MAQDQLSVLVTKAGVRYLDQECSSGDLLNLSGFCDPWELVGRHLRLQSHEISGIDEDNKNAELKRLGVLQKWKEKLAFKATYRVLVAALVSCGKADQAYKVCEFLARKER